MECVKSGGVQLERGEETFLAFSPSHFSPGYAFLKEAIPMSFVALSAYVNPRVNKDGQLQATHVANSKRKIRCMVGVRQEPSLLD